MASHFTVGDISTIEPDSEISEKIAHCWMDVANDGGAVGFPFIPVDITVVRAAVRRLGSELDHERSHVLGAWIGDELVGWVSIVLNPSPLTEHWAKIQHLQSHPIHRGEGIGAALLSRAVEHATSLGLEQLILTVRGGENLEPFYERHGWKEIGRQTGALRFADNDTRDEVLMQTTLKR